MTLSNEDIKYVAKLARIHLDDNELDDLSNDLSVCLEYFEKINAINTDGVAPTFQPNNLSNVMREDVVSETMNQEIVLKNAPEHIDGFFRIPKVIE